MPLSRRQLLARVGLMIAVVSGFWAVFLVTVGGLDVTVFGLRFTSNDVIRPLALIVFGLVLSAAAPGPRDPLQGSPALVVRGWRALAGLPTLPVAALLAAAVFVVGLYWGTRVAGGADSFGYVSQAELWATGELTIEQPWVERVPWPNAAWTFAPLGYRPASARAGDEIADRQTTLVPTYSPGVPLLMAIAKRLAGQPGVFAVGPLLGAVLILATYGIGRRLGAPHAGLLAAWFVATSPVMLYMLVQPMSDVPVTGAWALALWCLLGGSTGWAISAGAASGLAVLIRPNLVPIAGILVVWLALRAWRARPNERRPLVRRALAFAAAAAPAMLAVAVLNWTWYGSPLRSGYAPLRDLFDWANVAVNLPYYGRVFMDTQTPFALIGGLALLVPRAWTLPGVDRRWLLFLFAAVAAVVIGQYLAYAHFDDWTSLRFLLPVWPIVMLAFAMMLVQATRPGRPIAAVAVVAFALALGVQTVRVAADRGAFTAWRGESIYAAVGRLVGNMTEPGAVIFSMQHSGSLRYYGGRTTIQYMWMYPDRLDAAAAWLDEHGAHPYAVLADWEVPTFRERFGRTNVLGRLEMTPIVAYRDDAAQVFLFDLRPGSSNRAETIVGPLSREPWPEPAPRAQLMLR